MDNNFDFSSIKIRPERKFRKWCKHFLWTFSISAVLYIIWKLIDYFQSSGCGLLDKCTIAIFSLTGILSFIIYAVMEIIRQ